MCLASEHRRTAWHRCEVLRGMEHGGRKIKVRIGGWVGRCISRCAFKAERGPACSPSLHHHLRSLRQPAPTSPPSHPLPHQQSPRCSSSSSSSSSSSPSLATIPPCIMSTCQHVNSSSAPTHLHPLCPLNNLHEHLSRRPLNHRHRCRSCSSSSSSRRPLVVAPPWLSWPPNCQPWRRGSKAWASGMETCMANCRTMACSCTSEKEKGTGKEGGSGRELGLQSV